MLFFFLFLLLAVNAAVLPRGPTDCEDEFEDIEMSVFNDGPSVTGDAGIGAEFETPLVNFQNSACSLDDTFAAKRKLVQGRSGKNFVLSVDTGSTELGAGKLNLEYILDGTSIKVGDGSAAAAGVAATNDFLGWTPWTENPPNQITILDYPQCNPWTITGLTPNTNKGNINWAPQVTAPMPLEGIYTLMKENVNPPTAGRNVLNGMTSFTTGQNIQLVTQEYFQSASLKIDASTVTDDMLGFCTLVLSYAKAATLVQAPDVSPKHWLAIMPRTEFNTIFAEVKSKFTIPLFDVFNTLACYTTDSYKQLILDSNYCTGTTASPVPGTKFAGLQYKFIGEGFPDPTNPQTVNIKEWIQNIGLGNPSPDLFSAFDKNYDSSIGGLNTATEKMFNSQRTVPLFEFRDLDPLKTTDFGSFMGTVDSSIQALHKQFATRKIRVRRQSDSSSCTLSDTPTGNPTTAPKPAAAPNCGPNLGQIPCPIPDCGTNLGQPPCPNPPSPPPTPSSSTTSSMLALATLIPVPAGSAPCNDIEECDRNINAAMQSCKSPDDCTAGCAQTLANNTQALTAGFLSVCFDDAVCKCSVAAAEIIDDILIALGDIVCVVWNEALQGAAAILAFVIPYVGEAAEGVDATELFEAANQVFKKGAKDCNIACPGHQYTAVDPMDLNSMIGINECGDDEPTS